MFGFLKKKLSAPVGEQDFPVAMKALSDDSHEFLVGEFAKKLEFFRDSRNSLLSPGVEPDGNGFRRLYALGTALYVFNAANGILQQGYVAPAHARKFAQELILLACLERGGKEFADKIFETSDSLEAERIFAFEAAKLVLGDTRVPDSVGGYLWSIILIESQWLSMTVCVRVAKLFGHAQNIKAFRDERDEWERALREQAYKNLKTKPASDLAAVGKLIVQR